MRHKPEKDFDKSGGAIQIVLKQKWEQIAPIFVLL